MIPDIKKEAPGSRMIKKMELSTKAYILGFGGAIFFSMGLFAFINGIISKQNNSETFIYALKLVYGLLFIVGGLFCVAQATRFKILIDVNQRMKKMQKRLLKKQKQNQKSKSSKNKNASEN